MRPCMWLYDHAMRLSMLTNLSQFPSVSSRQFAAPFRRILTSARTCLCSSFDLLICSCSISRLAGTKADSPSGCRQKRSPRWRQRALCPDNRYLAGWSCDSWTIRWLKAKITRTSRDVETKMPNTNLVLLNDAVCWQHQKAVKIKIKKIYKT